MNGPMSVDVRDFIPAHFDVTATKAKRTMWRQGRCRLCDEADSTRVLLARYGQLRRLKVTLPIRVFKMG